MSRIKRFVCQKKLVNRWIYLGLWISFWLSVLVDLVAKK